MEKEPSFSSETHDIEQLAELDSFIPAAIAEIEGKDRARVFPFLKTFIENQRSELTRQEYHRDLHAFGNYLAVRFPEIRHPREMTRHHLIRYKVFLESKEKAPATISRGLSAISAYFQFLAAEGIVERDICYGVKRPLVINKKETAVLDPRQVEDILGAIPLNSASGLLHHALLSVLFGTGLRSRAIRFIRYGDITEEQGHRIVRVTTKGGKKEIHPLRSEVWFSMKRYIDALENAGIRVGEDSYLFQAPPKRARNSSHGRPIAQQVFNWIFKRYCRAIGLTDSNSFRYSPHSGRGTFATNLIEAGVSIDEVQAELGHASIQTTRKYVKRKRSLDERAAYKLPYFSNSLNTTNGK